MIELSKKDKKAIREIIEKGLMKEFEKGLEKTEKIISNWRNQKEDNRETYHKLFKHIRTFDKHIAQRYDDMRGSNYIYIVAAQLHENLIDEEDLKMLSDETANSINLILKISE